MAKKKISTTKKKKNIKLPFGKLYVKTTFNNTIVTLTDENGNKISGGGTWLLGYKWTKKSTPYAAEMLTKQILKEARDQFWLKEIGIIFKGLGLWRDGVFKAINDLGGIDIMWIREETPIQFGWCKRPRPRRT